jgi:hypothetical protein
MNTTNRALNRAGLLLVGLVLLAVGAAAVVFAAVPELLTACSRATADLGDRAARLVRTTDVDALGGSWLYLATAAACVLLIVLLVVAVLRQGQGHARALVTEEAATSDADSLGGAVVIDGRVAEQAIQDALDGHPGLLSSSVSTWSVRGVPTLKVVARVRRGVSPDVVRASVDETVAAWDALLGRETPVFVHITTGLAGSSRTTRVDAQRVEPVDN